MGETRTTIHAGGCQCGAVRYALYSEPTECSICHCRMCQKAVGGFFSAFAGVPSQDIAWTRGAPSVFSSSELVERGFCRDCGTPLMFRYVDTDRISVSLGSLDHPSRVKPTHQYGIESRMPWFRELDHLPAVGTEDAIPPERMAQLTSRQHPDRDT